MAEDREGLLRHYRSTREALLSAIANLSGGLLIEPSLDGWSIKDHLAHLATWDEIRATEILRISAGHESAWRTTGEQDDTVNAVAYDIRRRLSLAQVRWELETSRQRVLDAITSASPRALDPSLYGEAGLRSDHEAQHTGWIHEWRTARGV